MQVSNQIRLFNNKTSNNTPQFGALKIDRRVLSSQNYDGYYQDAESLNHLNNIGKDLKDTKYYDLYIKYWPYYGGDDGVFEQIVNKQGKNICDNDKDICSFINDPYRISHYKNRITISADTRDWDDNLPTLTDKRFEVSSEEEAEHLANNFKNAVRKSDELAREWERISCYDEVRDKQCSIKRHTAHLDKLVGFLNILEASKKYEDVKIELKKEAELNALDHIDKSFIDII